MEQCLFEGLKLKQFLSMLYNDGVLKRFGSILLGNRHNSSCHLRCLEKTGSADEVPVEKWLFQKLQNVVWIVDEPGLARVSSRVLPKMCFCKNAR